MAGLRLAKLTMRNVRLYQQITGKKEVRCIVCGKLLHVGDRVVKHGKLRVREKKMKQFWKKKFLFFECEECWMKRFYDFEDPTEEEVEKLEVLTVPFLNLEEVKLKW